MAFLKPDRQYSANGLTVYEYLLTKHNPNKIDMPSGNRKKTVAITIHNTGAISCAAGTTPAEQYTRATVNGNMRTTRVNYYISDTCAWQMLPDDYVNWSCADGTSNPNSGNNTSIAIEIIGDSAKAEENGAKLAAYLLDKYNLTLESGLRTHTYWLNARDGVKGTIDELNVKKHPYKTCPIYIIPHWSTFKSKVKSYMKSSGGAAATKPATTTSTTTSFSPSVYRIRKSWDDATSQIGAYASLDNAKKAWKSGYTIYDPNGKAVYPTTSAAPAPQKEKPKVDFTYQVYAGGKWYPAVKNLEDYAGVVGKPIQCLAAKASKGTLKYRVHTRNGKWLPYVSQYNINDYINGYAGTKGTDIDAIEMQLSGVDGVQVQYRISQKNKSYSAWTKQGNGAGQSGIQIDRIQIQAL